jgi:hypothetical protein
MWLSVASNGFRSSSMNAAIVFHANLGVLGLFSCTGDPAPGSSRALLKGLFAGAVVSAIYAIYQRFALTANLPFGIPPLNNASYTLYSDFEAIADKRSYAFFPEPSALASFLICAACGVLASVLVRTGRSLTNGIALILLLLALLSSGSLSLFLILPLAALITMLSCGVTTNRMLKLGSLVVGLVSVYVVVASAWEGGATQYEHLLDRFDNLLVDNSFRVRIGCHAACIRLFLENPVFGAGVVPTLEQFQSQMTVEALQYQPVAGSVSLVLGILAGHGAVGMGCFASLLLLGWKRTRTDPVLRAWTVGAFVAAGTLTGYETLYHCWLLLAFAMQSTRKALGPTVIHRAREVSDGSVPSLATLAGGASAVS